jgi:hypothetical protein
MPVMKENGDLRRCYASVHYSVEFYMVEEVFTLLQQLLTL